MLAVSLFSCLPYHNTPIAFFNASLYILHTTFSHSHLPFFTHPRSYATKNEEVSPGGDASSSTEAQEEGEDQDETVDGPVVGAQKESECPNPVRRMAL